MENSRIRPELLVHKNLVNEIPIDKLLKIEKVALSLEGKEKQPNTIDSFRRRIAVLARNANLDNPQEVELVIARYKLTDPKTKKYFHLLANTNGEWIVEGTTNKNRAMQLIVQDFIYVNTTSDGTMIYKKAK